MYLGTYVENEKIYITVATHKFETGEEFNGVLSGYYTRIGDTFGDKISISFNPVPDEVGLYYAEINTIYLAGGVYLVIVKADINTVKCKAVDYFTIRDVGAIYGVSLYGKCEYVL